MQRLFPNLQPFSHPFQVNTNNIIHFNYFLFCYIQFWNILFCYFLLYENHTSLNSYFCYRFVVAHYHTQNNYIKYYSLIHLRTHFYIIINCQICIQITLEQKRKNIIQIHLITMSNHLLFCNGCYCHYKFQPQLFTTNFIMTIINGYFVGLLILTSVKHQWTSY